MKRTTLIDILTNTKGVCQVTFEKKVEQKAQMEKLKGFQDDGSNSAAAKKKRKKLLTDITKGEVRVLKGRVKYVDPLDQGRVSWCLGCVVTFCSKSCL